MAAKNKVTASIRPTTPRASPAERRAAEIARLATKQEQLKNEAALRRQARELSDESAPPTDPNTPARPRRPPGKGGGR